jgi:hypothetical protein
MKNFIKLVLDLSEIKDDPELGAELSKENKPFKVAAVRNGEVLATTEVNLKGVDDYSAVPVSLEYASEGELSAGAYLLVGPNLPEEEFLAVESRRLWLPPKRFIDGVADLRKEKLIIPKLLYRRWLWLCRTFIINGKVVKRVDGCDEAVPGATVEAFDVDCWWCWWRRDLIGTTVTGPDGSFEMKVRWCCLLPFPFIKPPILKPRPPWIIDPDLLRRLTEAIKPHIGPIPPEALKTPAAFDQYVEKVMDELLQPDTSMATAGLRMIQSQHSAKPLAAPSLPLPPPKPDIARLKQSSLSKSVKRLVDELRPLLPPIPCWPFWPRDCTPDIVFKVTQECEGEVRVIYDENPFQTRWNIPSTLSVTLFADEEACSISTCEEPPIGESCLKFTKVNCVDVSNIGESSGPPDLRGYAYPGSGDSPFTGVVRMRGLHGAGSLIDYIRPEYAYNGGSFGPFPKENLRAFNRRYWAPPPGSPPGTPSRWNSVLFKPHEVDGEIVYKTLKLAEDENPLPASWSWGYLWSDLDTQFYWSSNNLDGDGLYTIQLRGYRWDAATSSLTDEGVLQTCEIVLTQDEQALVRIDNRLADDPTYPESPNRPCGAGTIHLCSFEPDCDFVRVDLINSSGTSQVDPCDIIQLDSTDELVIHFQASDKDGHLAGYHMHAHWGENRVFDVITKGALEADSDTLVGPRYANTFVPSVPLNDRSALPVAHPDRERPMWHGGSFKVTLRGSDFEESCAYTIKLRVWKRSISHCADPYHVHVNWCSYSFTINKV